ncbi:MAG: glycerophosphodiester phosphodiesterase family protein, partial [Lachnospiraceae bacterium]|nr:glycerophosphodiester phosphodiesterase family protein [Lachnospiraceae bacterium]
NLFCVSFFFSVICYLFSFHYIIIGKKTARQARKSAYQTMKSSWKNFARRYLLFLLKSLLIGAVIILGTFVLLFGTAVMMERYTPVSFRFVITFITILLLGIADLYMMLFTPFQVMELTRIYESYTEEDEGEILFPKKRKHPFMIAVVAAFILFDVGISFLSDREFDTMFPKVDQTEIIVHRAGGTLGNENTVYGLEQAIAVGAMASEIDVQRTKDGYYILNHDHTFQRLAGDSRTSEEMTLSEIKQLRVPAYNSLLGEEQEFATLDEILDAAEGRIHLYIEMKGATADEQMAEDLYRRVSERKMLDEVTFISLSYPMISYMETEHPDAVTGYLCYASLGELAELPADELILEEEIATPENIEKIHQAGKRVSVWTVNQAVSRVRFFARNADAIITDEAEDSMEFRKLLRDLCGSDPGVQLFDEETADLIRVLFRVLFVWWP